MPAPLRRLRLWIAGAVVLAVVATIVPWLLTRHQLAAGWTPAKLSAALAACASAGYPNPSGAVSPAACRCVTAQVSHTLPLGLTTPGAGASAGQAEVARTTAACNRAHPAR
jgi:hypothetical protein